MKKNIKKAKRINKQEQLRVRTGVKSGQHFSVKGPGNILLGGEIDTGTGRITLF